jgi:serine protease AprX
MARTRTVALRPSDAIGLTASQALRRLPALSRSAAVALAVAVLGVVAVPGAWQPAGPLWPKADPALLKTAEQAGPAPISVIVRESRPRSDRTEALVRRLGGRISHELPIVGGFSARLPANRLGRLARSALVQRVWGDGRVRMSTDTSQINTSTPPNNVWQQTIRLDQAWQKGWNGSGVTVALLDTGVTQNADLGNRVLARVDFTPDQDGLDHYGHGTHMAGIIAGDGSMSGGQWSGVAPRANLVSVKVAGADGSTDVSVVIAGLQWVVSHRSDYNIRVLNLSFGTNSQQSYLVDPLDYAVEQVWFSGITVIVAAGNRGPAAGTVNKPADDPFVSSVGAADLNGTQGSGDDSVASFSSRGPTQDGVAKPGVVAPGVTIVSDRAPGSTIDQAYASARVGTSYFKGTGTSQAAAVVSGVVALMYQVNPNLTPDVVKAILKAAAQKQLAGQSGAGAGLVDAYSAVQAAPNGYYTTIPANVGVARSTGVGSLEASRGSLHVYADLPQDGLGASDADGQLDLVQGDLDALGGPWSPGGWLATGWSATGWSGTSWSSVAWSATGWSATGWSATGWSGTSWSATGWSATGWSATSWSGTSWSGTSWSGTSWS